MVVHYIPQKRDLAIDDTVEIVVDAAYSNRWREEPWHSDIRKLSRSGLDAKRFVTLVAIKGKRKWLVLPTKDVEWSGQLKGVFARVGPDGEWDFFRHDNPQAVIGKM
jgi:hypothetical protein